METVLAEGKPLLTREQQRQVDEAIREQITDNPTIAESPLNQTIFQALGMGVGLHHAGILPTVKRLIELLFERGLCKVVFATETMSLGIHMPAKSVVLQSLTKRTDRGFRSLTHNELTQMAGRAGRRGIDPEGKCVMALDVRDGLDDMRRVVDGPPEPIASQFKLGYGSVALLLSTGQRPGDDPAHRRVLVRPVPEPEAHPRRSRPRWRAWRWRWTTRAAFTRPCGDFSRIGRYRQARAEVEAARMARGRGGRRGRAAADAEPGRLALVRRKSGGQPRPHRAGWTGGATAISSSVLLPHGGTVQMKEGNVKRVFWQTPPHARPARLGAAHPRPHRADGPPLGARADRAREEPGARGARSPRSSATAARGARRAAASRPGRASTAGAPARPEAGDARRLQQRLLAGVPPGRRGARALRRGAGRQAPRPRASSSPGSATTTSCWWPRWSTAASSRDTTLAEAAALCSWLIEESRSGDGAVARLFLKKRPKLRHKLQEMESIADTVLEVAAAARQLPMPVGHLHRLHAVGVPVGFGRGRLVRHRGGVLRRPRGGSDPRHAPAHRRAPPARGVARGASRWWPASSAGRPASSTAASCWSRP